MRSRCVATQAVSSRSGSTGGSGSGLTSSPVSFCSSTASSSAPLEPKVRKSVTSLTPASAAMSRVVAPRNPCFAYTRAGGFQNSLSADHDAHPSENICVCKYLLTCRAYYLYVQYLRCLIGCCRPRPSLRWTPSCCDSPTPSAGRPLMRKSPTHSPRSSDPRPTPPNGVDSTRAGIRSLDCGEEMNAPGATIVRRSAPDGVSHSGETDVGELGEQRQSV